MAIEDDYPNSVVSDLRMSRGGQLTWDHGPPVVLLTRRCASVAMADGSADVDVESAARRKPSISLVTLRTRGTGLGVLEPKQQCSAAERSWAEDDQTGISAGDHAALAG